MSEEKVEAYFKKQEGEVAAIARALRGLLNGAGNQLTCKLAWGFPCWSGNERVASISALKDRCNLQLFYGNQLAERWPGRIEGTGKQMRHIKIRSLTEVDKELAEIIARAVELDQTNPTKIR